MSMTTGDRNDAASAEKEEVGLCCWFLKYGKCEPPRPPCRFRHEPDIDKTKPCCFGATCRLGHSKRALAASASSDEKLAYWRDYNQNDAKIGVSPAVRDATLLRSQLEPWPTAVLRERLVSFGHGTHADLDPLGRGEIMKRLLEYYESSGNVPRKLIHVRSGTPVREELCMQLLKELKLWRARHNVNTRPSIHAKSYMILRSPLEFGAKDSSRARQAAKKLKENQTLWNLAHKALSEVDPDFCSNFSALAATYGFTGSPHIDKQNTGPFYGLALGDFEDGQGGVCVEASPLVVAQVNTKNCLAKVDGRFPHWVAPYEGERYSLIYYSTWQKYEPPRKAYYGEDDIAI